MHCPRNCLNALTRCPDLVDHFNENLYLQFLGGALDPRHWLGMARHMKDVSSVPGLQAYWADRGHWFTEEFRNFWENEVSLAPENPNYHLMGTR